MSDKFRLMAEVLVAAGVDVTMAQLLQITREADLLYNPPVVRSTDEERVVAAARAEEIIAAKPDGADLNRREITTQAGYRPDSRSDAAFAGKRHFKGSPQVAYTPATKAVYVKQLSNGHQRDDRV